MRERKNPDDRKAEILKAAMAVAQEHGYTSMTRGMVADEAGVSAGLVSHYYGTTLDLQNAVMTEAVRLQIPEIIRDGILARDPIAHNAPTHLKKAAWGTMI